MHDHVTSIEISAAEPIRTMPAASPISDFPNTLMEPEMLSFEHPSTVSKKIGFPGRFAFSTVTSSHIIMDSTSQNTNHGNGFFQSKNKNDDVHLEGNRLSNGSPNTIAMRMDNSGCYSGNHADNNDNNNNNNNKNRNKNNNNTNNNSSSRRNYNPTQYLNDMSRGCIPKSDGQFSTNNSSSLCQQLLTANDKHNDGLNTNSKSLHIYTDSACLSTSNTMINEVVDDVQLRSPISKNLTNENKEFQNSDSDRIKNSYDFDVIKYSLKRSNTTMNSLDWSHHVSCCNSSNSIRDCCGNSNTFTTITSGIAKSHPFELDHKKVYTNLDNNETDSHERGHPYASNSELIKLGHSQRFPTETLQSHRYFSIPQSSLPNSSTPTLISLSSTPSMSPPLPPPPSSSPSCMYVRHKNSPSESSQLHSDCSCSFDMPAISHPAFSSNASSSKNQSAHAYNDDASALYSHSSSYSRCELTQATTSSQSISFVPMSLSKSLSNDEDYPLDNNDNDKLDDNDGSCPAQARKKSFLCESPDHFMQDEGDENSMSWTFKAAHYWSSSEVLDWLFYVAQEQGLDMQKLRAENFQSVSGGQLCQMERDDFTRLEPTFGLVLYDMLQKLMAGECYPKAEVTCSCYSHHSTSSPVYSSHSDSSHFEMGLSVSNSSQPFHESTPLFSDIKQEEASCIFQEGVPPQTHFFKQEQPDNTSMHYTPYNYDINDTPSTCLNVSQGLVYPGDCYAYQSPSYQAAAHTASHPASIRPPCCYSAPPPPPPALPRRKPGRPRLKNAIQVAKTSRDKKAKNQHLWEFIYEILMNPMYNPQFLKWENQREGVFRFVQSEAVAQLWGGRKNNENMTYEKLSRAMRHYYRRGILERVEGRRLVYKFSLKAIDKMKSKKSNNS